MYSELFTLQASLFKAMAHPRRLEIIRLLREQPLIVSDIYEMLDLPQANISQHLMILRDAGIVVARRDGKQITYSLANTAFIEATDLVRDFLIDHHQGSELAKHLHLSMKELTPLTHDPVCGMRVSPKTANFHCQHNGSSYFFCASGCLQKFEKSPGKYDKKR